MKKIKMTIKGMHCNSCAKIIESELQDKVKSISISYETGKALIEFDEKKINENEIGKIIKELGYSVN